MFVNPLGIQEQGAISIFYLLFYNEPWKNRSSGLTAKIHISSGEVVTFSFHYRLNIKGGKGVLIFHSGA